MCSGAESCETQPNLKIKEIEFKRNDNLHRSIKKMEKIVMKRAIYETLH